MDQGFYSFRETGDRTYQSFALELVPGTHCQLRCRNCYMRNGAKSKKSKWDNMPFNFVLNALSQALRAGFSEAVFIGGEPTLHPDLPYFVYWCLQYGLSPIVCTNGIRLADPEYADELARPGTTLVIHAPLPAEVHDSHVNLPGYAAQLDQAYKNVLGREGVTVVAEVVITKTFLPYIPALYEWCQENGVTPFIEIDRIWDNGKRDPDAASPEQVLDLFQRLQGDQPVPEVLLPPAFGQTCSMSITGLHVKNFGGGDCYGVYSCCGQGVQHGDLQSQTVSEVLESPSLQVFMDQDTWIVGPCKECSHYPLCKGGCRGEAFLTFGCPRASSPMCWNLDETTRTNPTLMAPSTCAGCPLEGNEACHPHHLSLGR